MQILQISSEMTPIAKVGGLGDVIMGLSRELASRGHDVLTLLPFYGSIDTSQLVLEGKKELFETICEGHRQKAQVVYYRFKNGVRVAFLDTEHKYFQKCHTIYGGEGEAAKFISFSRAVIEWLRSTGNTPDVLHVHDWPTALIPLIHQQLPQARKKSSTVFTIHNFDYQGRCSWEDFKKAGFSQEDFPEHVVLKDSLYDCLNLVKAGLLSSNIVTTVSPTYAQEVVTEKGGTGLDKVLKQLNERFVGILNGIDDVFWNPATDQSILEHYCLDERGVETVRAAKQRNKEIVFSNLGIPLQDSMPLVASVTRLVRQKGIHMIRDLFARAEKLQFQCILLGSVPEPGTEELFKELDCQLRSKGQGAVVLMNDEVLAHQIYAASDMFVVPSLFEPCGLTQLIALKYGSVPIVRRTGGLADTVVDINREQSNSNGFVFEQPTSEAFIGAVMRALTFFKNRLQWEELMERGMTQDFSWKRPADQYEALYSSIA